MLSRTLLILLLFGKTAVFLGCTSDSLEVIREVDEKQYQLGQDYKAQGRTEEALNAFLRVVDARRDAPESHLEAGYIYLKTLKDPIRSIYHFDRYLQLKPQSSQAKQVEQLIKTARKEFARQLPGEPFSGQLDRIDLMDLVENLRIENEALKKDLALTEAKLRRYDPTPTRPTEATTTSTARSLPRQQLQAIRPQASAGLPQRDRTTDRQAQQAAVTGGSGSYVVQSGDSLSSISRRFYGTPSRWIDIFQANRDSLSSENALKVGQTIRIP